MSEKKKYIPPSKKEVLSELKKIDKFDLLNIKAKNEQPTVDSILKARFEEINTFIDENKRLPNDKGSLLFSSMKVFISSNLDLRIEI